MTEFARSLSPATVLVVCGTVLLVSGDTFGRDLITLGAGIVVGREEK